MNTSALTTSIATLLAAYLSVAVAPAAAEEKPPGFGEVTLTASEGPSYGDDRHTLELRGVAFSRPSIYGGLGLSLGETELSGQECRVMGELDVGVYAKGKLGYIRAGVLLGLEYHGTNSTGFYPGALVEGVFSLGDSIELHARQAVRSFDSADLNDATVGVGFPLGTRKGVLRLSFIDSDLTGEGMTLSWVVGRR